MTTITKPNGEKHKERRVTINLSEEEIDFIAEKAAEKAVAKMTANVYQSVGKNVIGKLFWIIGISAVALYAFLSSKGMIK